MGGIINTTYKDTVESLVGMSSDLINNSFYLFTDKKGTKCTYYNINKEYSSLDKGSGLTMDNTGADSSIRFNKIEDFYIFGAEKIQLQMENGEFGLEASQIDGEAYIIPNTIIPYEGDYFEINHIKDSTWLFMVKDVQKDTLDNGANVYKISYKLELTDNSTIKKNVIDDFKMIEASEGTNTKSIIKSSDLDKAVEIDKKNKNIIKYFYELFYDDKVQTFVYQPLTSFTTYDYFMIQFIKKNRILDGMNPYIYPDHQLPLPNTFELEYTKTIFDAVEKKDIERLATAFKYGSIVQIKNISSIFATRFIAYYKMEYDITGIVSMIDDDLINRIRENKLYNPGAKKKYLNIIIRYFNNTEFTDKELEALDNIMYEQSTELFYLLPILSFCLKYSIKSLLK